MTLFGRKFRFKGRRHRRHRGGRCLHPRAGVELTLADVPPGSCMRVLGFLPGLSANRKAQLQAYGMTPGHCVRVLQHSPVTVVQVEHTELALEGDLARQVRVEAK